VAASPGLSWTYVPDTSARILKSFPKHPAILEMQPGDGFCTQCGVTDVDADGFCQGCGATAKGDALDALVVELTAIFDLCVGLRAHAVQLHKDHDRPPTAPVVQTCCSTCTSATPEGCRNRDLMVRVWLESGAEEGCPGRMPALAPALLGRVQEATSSDPTLFALEDHVQETWRDLMRALQALCDAKDRYQDATAELLRRTSAGVPRG
jgi:hypothetical protein